MSERIEYDKDGSLDEFVISGIAHFERMRSDGYFLSVTRHDGSSFCLWVQGTVTMIEERDGPKRTKRTKGERR